MWETIREIIRFIKDNPHIPISREILQFCNDHKKAKGFEQLGQEIEQHNHAIAKRYTAKVLQKFGDLPDIKTEIERQSQEGYVLIGYKGVDLDRITRFRNEDFNVDYHGKLKNSAGTSRGGGFYTTPHFASAVDFEARAATVVLMGEAPEPNGSSISKLLERIDSLRQEENRRTAEELPNTLFQMVCSSLPSHLSLVAFCEKMHLLLKRGNDGYVPDYSANADFEKITCFYGEMQRQIERDSVMLQQHATIVRIYVQNFFTMNGLTLDPDDALPADWEKFDYLEGIIQGGDREKSWEIKFNKHKTIYGSIRAISEPRSYVGYDLPLGFMKMLQEAADSNPISNYESAMSFQSGIFERLKSLMLPVDTSAIKAALETPKQPSSSSLPSSPRRLDKKEEESVAKKSDDGNFSSEQEGAKTLFE